MIPLKHRVGRILGRVGIGQSSGPAPLRIPLAFDPNFYRTRYADLRGFSNQQLADHYESYGRAEGRAASSGCFRNDFLRLIDRGQEVLEIGPFGKPTVRGANVRYFDVLDQDALRARAGRLGGDVNSVPPIQYVEPNGDLAIVQENFAAAVSSHCIEHQPDLIYHLQQVERILEAGGHYYLLIPNKLYCFDHFIAESTIAQVVEAHRNRNRVHRLTSVIEHRALTTHNDPTRHWNDDHADPSYWPSIAARTQAAMSEFDAARGTYIDVHAWQFTPASFRRIIEQLNEMALIGLQPARVYDTPYGSNEFTAILAKPA